MVREISITLVESQKGIIARYSGKPVSGHSDEFIMVSTWEDSAVLRAFPGEQWEAVVIPEEERSVLLEAHIHSCEVFGEIHHGST